MELEYLCVKEILQRHFWKNLVGASTIAWFSYLTFQVENIIGKTQLVRILVLMKDLEFFFKDRYIAHIEAFAVSHDPLLYFTSSYKYSLLFSSFFSKPSSGIKQTS